MHVLIVEDDCRTSTMIGEVLKGMGFASISVAETEQEAVGAALARRPDLIISDVQLREGVGPSAVHRIHAAVGAVSTFYLTASPAYARRHDPKAVVLVKPVVRQTLIETIAQHARSGTASRLSDAA